MPVGAGALLRHRSFLLFLLSRSLSRFSSQIGAVAIGWQIYDLTGSAFDLGMVGLVQFLPTALLVFVAGNAADRYERKRVVQLCQFAEALTALLLAWGAYAGWLTVIAYFHRVLRAGNGRRVREPGDGRAAAADRAAGLAAARDRDVERRRATGDHHRARARRPRLCARARLPYGIMVLFWLLGAILTGGIRLTQPAAVRDSATPGDLFAGVRFVRNNPAILGTISLDLFAVLLGGVTALLPIYARDILQTGPCGLGILRAAPAVGALADDGGSGAPYHQPPRRHADVSGRHRVRRGDGGVRAVALDVAVGAGAGDPGRGRYRQRGDPVFAGAAGDARTRCAAASAR